MICKNSKKIMFDFIKYLETDNKKYEFRNGGWSYDKEIYDFMIFCEKEKIILKYKNAKERAMLINKDDNIDIMSIEEIRKYLNVIFYSERFHEGIIMNKIKNGKLKIVLEKLIN